MAPATLSLPASAPTLDAAALIDALAAAAARRGSDSAGIAHDLAHDYDALRALWLATGGGEAETALLARLDATGGPRARVLDAGCGAGAIAAHVLARRPRARVTGVDLAPAMLDRAAGLGIEAVEADVAGLPFPSGSFDIVVAAWTLDVVADPRAVMAELQRVLKPSGRLLMAASSLPGGFLSHAGATYLRAAIRHRMHRMALAPETRDWHGCGALRTRFRGGLTAATDLGACCPLAAPLLPARC